MVEPLKYYARGKLLLTGEYSVLDGALALAIPTKFGQWLEVENLVNRTGIHWKSVDVNNHTWFSVEFDPQFNIQHTSDIEVAKRLQQILQVTLELNPAFSSLLRGRSVTTTLEFDRNWGLGSSSTLIHLISEWGQINAYDLLRKTLKGSGYDIACAGANTPLLYQLKSGQPQVTPVVFQPEWAHHMYFVHLGKKQLSHQEVRAYSQLSFNRMDVAKQVSRLTKAILAAPGMDAFTSLLVAHENLMSKVLQRDTIHQKNFPNIEGTFKSLGAWGGDFVLFIGNETAVSQIKKMGYTTIIPYQEMVFTRKG